MPSPLTRNTGGNSRALNIALNTTRSRSPPTGTAAEATAHLALSSATAAWWVVREALQRQLALAEFRELRRQIMPLAEARGYLTDDDVFRDVS